MTTKQMIEHWEAAKKAFTVPMKDDDKNVMGLCRFFAAALGANSKKVEKLLTVGCPEKFKLAGQPYIGNFWWTPRFALKSPNKPNKSRVNHCDKVLKILRERLENE